MDSGVLIGCPEYRVVRSCDLHLVVTTIIVVAANTEDSKCVETLRFDERVEERIGVDVRQAGRAVRNQKHAQRSAEQVANAAVTGVPVTGIGNEKKLWPDSLGKACRVTALAPGCNTAEGQQK